MHAAIEINLAMILFLPWFAILSLLYWMFPRQPRGWARRVFDLGALLLAFVATGVALQWSFHHADPAHGSLWPQLLATSVAYGVFLAVMLGAVVARQLLIVRSAHRRRPADSSKDH